MGSIAVGLFFHNLSVIPLYIASAVEGSFFVFANLGRFASFPKVVAKEQFPAAVAQSGTADHLALLIGPPLGGFLYQAVGGGFLAFFVDSLSYFVNAVSIFFINIPLGAATSTDRKAIRHEIKEAFLWFWHQPILRFLNVITAGRTVLAAGLYLLILVLAKEHHASALSIGFIFATGAGGGILGSILAAKIHQHFTMSQLLLGISLLSFIIFTLYAVATTNLFLAAITALFYAVDPLYDVTTSAYSAKIIPNEIRGKVTSLTRLVILGAYSFGFFITGNFLEYLGSLWTIGIFSVLLFVLFLGIALNRKKLA
jgi:predicted MFS family arabinose efflux permease